MHSGTAGQSNKGAGGGMVGMRGGSSLEEEEDVRILSCSARRARTDAFSIWSFSEEFLRKFQIRWVLLKCAR